MWLGAKNKKLPLLLIELKLHFYQILYTVLHIKEDSGEMILLCTGLDAFLLLKNKHQNILFFFKAMPLTVL